MEISLLAQKNKVSLLCLLLVFIAFTTNAKTYYVSPNGNSGNSGNDFNNALDFKTALSKATAGDVLHLQNGKYSITYKSGEKNTIYLSKSGTAQAPITIMATNGEPAVIDFSFPAQAWVQDSYGFDITGDYWYFKNIDVTRAGYQGVYVKGAHNTFDNCAFYNNRNTGLEINKGGSYTTVLNCDAYKNYDPKKNGSMADGFGPKQEQGPGNKFIGCRAWENSDDGYDCYDSEEKVTFENCWAFRNGVDVWNYGNFEGNGNGFKVGGNHVPADNSLSHCVAFGHPNKGFDQNNNRGSLTILNCTSYDNGDNYGLGGDLNSGEQNYLRNNISLDGGQTIANADQSYNTWNSGFSVSSSDFISLNTSLATIDRNTDGSIPYTDLFRLKPTSNLVDAGTNVGLPYDGTAPDLGAFEVNLNLDCNGVENGTATLDQCGVCTGGTTNVTPCTGSIQAEDACSFEGTVDNDNLGFTGTGFVNTPNVVGTTIQWVLNANSAVETQLNFVYAHGGTSARGAILTINGTVISALNFGATGSWTSWKSETIDVSLNAGPNRIELTSTTDGGIVNLDQISLETNEVTQGSCGEDCAGVTGGLAYEDACGLCVEGTTGITSADSDNDGTLDCEDNCPNDANKTEPGICGCGVEESSCVDCLGEVNGSAYLDNCGVCVGGNSVNLACNETMQAEEACYIDGILLEDINTGYTGEGYVNTENAVGSTIQWTINSDKQQTATLTFVYANGGENPRNGELFINSVSYGTVTLSTTQDWTMWEQISVNVALEQGFNELELVAITDGGLANLDAIHLSEGVSDAQCLVTANTVFNNATELQIYPNPTNGTVFLGEENNWELLNLQGKKLDRGKGKTVELSDYPAGIYIIKIEGQVFKVIKR